MARVNVYLPDPLAEAVKKSGLNVSGIAQEALTAALAAGATDDWLDDVARLGGTRVTHEEALQALHEARDEFGNAADA